MALVYKSDSLTANLILLFANMLCEVYFKL